MTQTRKSANQIFLGCTKFSYADIQNLTKYDFFKLVGSYAIDKKMIHMDILKVICHFYDNLNV